MRHRYVLLVTVFLGLASLAARADDQIRLFSYPGSNWTELGGINDFGFVVGSARIFANYYKFKWNVHTNELTFLPYPLDENNFHVEGIKNIGEIVGAAYIPDLKRTVGVMQTASSTGFYPHNTRPVRIMAINEAYTVTGSLRKRAFIYFQDSRSNGRLTDFLPSTFASANGINRFDTVVGQVLIPAAEDTCGGGPEGAELIQYGFVRYTDEFITLFQVNRQATYAGDIRDDGLIVGAVFDPVFDNDKIFTGKVAKMPCVFLRRHRSTLIGERDFQYVPRGITEGGIVVGTAIKHIDDGESTSYGFVTQIPVKVPVVPTH